MKPVGNSLASIIGIGAGGHCKVLIEIIRRVAEWEIVGLLDVDASRHGEMVSGVSILGSDDLAAELRKDGVRAAFIGIASVGSIQARRKAFTLLRTLGYDLPVLVHPSAVVAQDTVIGMGACIMPGVIVNPGARIGECAIINSGSIIEHDCRIFSFAHIAPGAVLGGAVHVGEGSLVGMGSVIRQGIRVGRNAIVGAGAVVVKDVKDDMTVTGVPAFSHGV